MHKTGKFCKLSLYFLRALLTLRRKNFYLFSFLYYLVSCLYNEILCNVIKFKLI